MKEYAVKVDVTMSGTVYVTAESAEQAEKAVKETAFVGSDLRNFCWVNTDIIETEEE